MPNNKFSRRSLLQITTLSATSMFLNKGNILHATKDNPFCNSTPMQPEGPFYPIKKPSGLDQDLTTLKGHNTKAKGQVIEIFGKITDNHCQPVSNCLVEIWQACFSGRYNHPGDGNNTQELDPNFQYTATALTNDEGEYWFKTIIPGHYEAGSNWIRPPHIHFKIQKRGFRELITQLYFEGNRYNDKDLILKSLSPEEKAQVIRPVDVLEDYGKVTFDISIEKLV